MAAPPSVLLVPGSFSNPDLYYTAQDLSLARGIDLHVMALPSVRVDLNDNRTPPSMYDDAAAIAEEIEKLSDAGQDVIVISHSYAGVPMTQATVGLGKESRKRQGKTAGLVGVAYMTSLVPDIGQNTTSLLADIGPEHALHTTVDEKGWLHQADLERLGEIVFTDLPEDQRRIYAQELAGHSAQSFADVTTQLGYLDEELTVSYLLCEKDMCVPPEVQVAGIKLIERLTGKTVTVTKIASDHVPVLSHPELVADWIQSLVEGTEQPITAY
jgi:pimeloyl-ACP methyl ester carboxylesterase